MKAIYHPLLKGLALVLAAAALLAAVLSGSLFAVLADMGLYHYSWEEYSNNRMDSEMGSFAYTQMAYAVRENLGDVQETAYEVYGYNWHFGNYDWRLDGLVDYTVSDEKNHVIKSTVDPSQTYEKTVGTFHFENVYCFFRGPALENGQDLLDGEMWAEPTGAPVDPMEAYVGNYAERDGTIIGVYRKNMGTMHVTLYERSGARKTYADSLKERYPVYLFMGCRNALPWICGISALVTLTLAVYLCFAAGRKYRDGSLEPGGLNRLPLDVYFILMTGVVCGCAVLGVEIADQIDFASLSADYLSQIGAAASLALLYAACLGGFVFLFAFAAQVKLPRHGWLRRCLSIRILLWCWRVTKKGGAFLAKACSGLFGMLPLIWRWVVIGSLGVLGLIITGMFAAYGDEAGAFFAFLVGLVSLGVVTYSGWCFGKLLDGVKRMAGGSLERGVDEKRLVLSYREFARSLNSLGGAAKLAAEKQLKSERMKTELITNVSHDIKTPLTSIINYVDLLQHTTDPEAKQQYLEVLSRQSQRLKKLIEDLMDMSKASTGNVTVNITDVDAGEALTQAVGEFADKLEAAGLAPVLKLPEKSVMARADGRLLWRVLSNLLGNTVKYAQPGTRVYADVERMGDRVQICLRNISREQLNVSAEELMERFVRGDASRNTEGSGLGLNIAKNLMELQKGSLELTVDGDLFKAVLMVPVSE